MKLEIEVPEVVCCRCGTKAPMMPTALKRTSGEGSVTDSAGNAWKPQGALMPQGWTQAPADASKLLCAPCGAEVQKGLAALLQPPAPAVPVKTAATSIPEHAEPPVVGKVIKSFPTPTQAAARVTGGARIYPTPTQRPEPVVSASPVIVQPSAISRPIAPAAPVHTPQPSTVLVGPPKIHAPIAPAERGSNVLVQSNSQFPQPKVANAQPVPLRGDVPRVREVAVQDNTEVEPQGPVTAVPLLRGTGV